MGQVDRPHGHQAVDSQLFSSQSGDKQGSCSLDKVVRTRRRPTTEAAHQSRSHHRMGHRRPAESQAALTNVQHGHDLLHRHPHAIHSAPQTAVSCPDGGQPPLGPETDAAAVLRMHTSRQACLLPNYDLQQLLHTTWRCLHRGASIDRLRETALRIGSRQASHSSLHAGHQLVGASQPAPFTPLSLSLPRIASSNRSSSASSMLQIVCGSASMQSRRVSALHPPPSRGSDAGPGDASSQVRAVQ